MSIYTENYQTARNGDRTAPIDAVEPSTDAAASRIMAVQSSQAWQQVAEQQALQARSSRSRMCRSHERQRELQIGR